MPGKGDAVREMANEIGGHHDSLDEVGLGIQRQINHRVLDPISCSISLGLPSCVTLVNPSRVQQHRDLTGYDLLVAIWHVAGMGVSSCQVVLRGGSQDACEDRWSSYCVLRRKITHVQRRARWP